MKVVCIYSGGMDSFTLVHAAQRQESLHSCLSFNYGQKHKKELTYAARVCENDLKVPHTVIELPGLAPCLLGSALTDSTPMPQGHYAAENMKLTVVPNRNMIMLSIAIAYAVSHQLQEVWFGAHGGDHTIYPDCRPEFVEGLSALAQIANWHPVTVRAPFLTMNKAEILTLGLAYGLEYYKSWTCYEGGEQACGKCGSCQERLDAFAQNETIDPLPYLTRELINE